MTQIYKDSKQVDMVNNPLGRTIFDLVTKNLETELREVVIRITGVTVGHTILYGSSTKYGRQDDKFQIPTYKMLVEGKNDLGEKQTKEFEVLRFGIQQLPNSNAKVVGLSESFSDFASAWDENNLPEGNEPNSSEKGGWVINGTHKILDGVDNIAAEIGQAIGHIEVCGINKYEEMNSYVRNLAGVNESILSEHVSHQEIVTQRKLKIIIDECVAPKLVHMFEDIPKTKKELDAIARERIANNQISFKEIDKLEGHNNKVFNTYHLIRLMDFILENADKEDRIAAGETEEAYKKCSPTIYFGINKLYNWQDEQKIISGYIEDRLNADNSIRDTGINSLMKKKGLTGIEERFWARTSNGELGTKKNNDKIDHWPDNTGPTVWALEQCAENGVHLFTVSVMGGYHSMMLIIDKRGDGAPEIFIKDQHHKTPALNRKKHHDANAVDKFFMKMITEWNGSSVPDNKTIRLLKLKRE